jgi:hypothetical protein
MGAQVTPFRRAVVVAVVALLVVVAVTPLRAAEGRRAVLVFGATGGDSYAKTWAAWEKALVGALRDRFGFPAEQIVVLTADAEAPGAKSTAAGVRAAFERMRSRAAKDDLVLVVLVGHGSVDAERAHFNLVGPDLEVSEWATLVDALPGRVVFVNAAGASFPFLERLSRQGRIVITATDATAQRFDTTLPEQLAKALDDPATDADRNGRVSVWEAFAQASAGVRQYYDQRGQLATERALLDDTGDRVGQEAGASGPDGALARTTYLDPEPAAASVNPEIAELVARQRALERAAEDLKLRKPTMPAPQWESEFERLMIELARVSRAIRSRS